MNVVPLLVVCSLCLAAFGVLLFVWSTRNQDHEHADRLALLPLEDDAHGTPSERVTGERLEVTGALEADRSDGLRGRAPDHIDIH